MGSDLIQLTGFLWIKLEGVNIKERGQFENVNNNLEMKVLKSIRSGNEEETASKILEENHDIRKMGD